MNSEQTVEFLAEAPPPAAPGPPAHATYPMTPEAGTRPAAPRRRWRFVPRGITARLVTGVVALVMVVVFATGIGTYFALRSFLYDRLAQQLDSAADSAASSPCLAVLAGGGPARCSLNQTISTGHHEWLTLVSPSGLPVRLQAHGNEITILSLSADLRREIVANPTRHYSYTTESGEQLRLAAAPVRGGGGYVVIGVSTADVANTLHQLVVKESLIGGAAIVIAFLATAGGVRYSLRRLKRVTATAREVAAELSPSGSGLDRRVPVTDGDTTEVGQLAASMNTLLSAVETQFAARLESEQRMRQFMADASHELRTPLTTIRGYAELARMQRDAGAAGMGHGAGGEGGEDAEANVADNLERIESEGTRMSRLVEDLLTLARGDQGSLPELAPVEVAELLDDVVASSRAAYPGREIVPGPAAEFTVIGDHDQLLRAVRNLVSNAATHTRPDGVIEVRAFASGAGVAIQVADQGPGLPPQDAAHVFERFWRADKARTRARGGTGLGLAIVASIAQLHHGTVHFASTVEHGSTVTIWLPVAAADPPEAPTS